MYCVHSFLKEEAQNQELGKLGLNSGFSNCKMKLKTESSDCVLADFSKAGFSALIMRQSKQDLLRYLEIAFVFLSQTLRGRETLGIEGLKVALVVILQ